MAELHTSKPDCPNGTTIREYFTLWLTKLEAALDERNEAQQRAVTTAFAAQDKRLDSMNEFRSSLSDKEKVSVTKSDFAGVIDPIKADIRELRDWRNVMNGKADESALARTTVVAVIGVISGILGIAAALVALFAK